MRVVVFSDVHVHPFSYAATEVELPGFRGSFNSRLVDCVQAIQEVLQYAKDNNIENVWFTGDLFHVKSTLRTEAHSVVYSVLKEAGHSGLRITMIPGNHDFADRGGFRHSLEAYDSITGITVASEPKLIGFKDVSVLAVPYVDNLVQLKDTIIDIGTHKTTKPTIFLGHAGVQGSIVGSDYVLVSDRDLDPTDLPMADFCFFGHYHEHQLITSNSIFVGALLQHNWGDVGGKRGFLDVTISGKDVTFKRIETKSPKFIVAKGTIPESNTMDFVRILTNNTLSDVPKCRNLEILPEPEVPSEVGTINTLDPEDVLSQWVDLYGKGSKSLLKIGRELLQKANEA